MAFAVLCQEFFIKLKLEKFTNSNNFMISLQIVKQIQILV